MRLTFCGAGLATLFSFVLLGCGGGGGGDAGTGGDGATGRDGAVGRACSEPSDCDDHVECTSDSCDDGHCTNMVPDGDGDGHGSAMCMDAMGHALGDDCDDTNDKRGPFPDGPAGDGMGYGCDMIDNNCDGTVDEGCTCTTGDMRACGSDVGTCIPGMQTCASGVWGDCMGGTGPVNEICGNMEDDDCDGQADDNQIPLWADRDDDGYGSGDVVFGCEVTAHTVGSITMGRDCDERDAMRNPGVAEVCDDVDNDCDGREDEGLVQWYYQDADGDGYGTDYVRQLTCLPPVGYSLMGGDCNDDPGDGLAASQHPGAMEVCNDMDGDMLRPVDNNCNETIDEGCPCTGTMQPCETLSRGAGYSHGMVCTPGMQACTGGTWSATCTGGNRPSMEVCDGHNMDSDDNDCDGAHDEGLRQQLFVDLDGDGAGGGAAARVPASDTHCPGMAGVAEIGGDCDEADPMVFPSQGFQTEMRFGANWDFNCDGWEEPEYPGQRYVSCGEAGNPCAHMGAQWVELMPPRGAPVRRAQCGETGTLMECRPMGGSCMPAMVMPAVLQRCR